MAIALEPAARREIAAALRPLAAGGAAVRWVRAENLHLTLAFLGEIDADALAPIDERLAPLAATFAAERLVLAGVGGFPASRPRVLWLGVEGGRTWFVTVARAVRAALEDDLGIMLDRRDPAAHVTLGRVNRPERALLPALTSAFAGRAIASRAERITLFSSAPGPGGPAYRAEREWPFAS